MYLLSIDFGVYIQFFGEDPSTVLVSRLQAKVTKGHSS